MIKDNPDMNPAVSHQKKQYATPRLLFTQLNGDDLLMVATSPVAPISNREADPDEENLGNRHRGSWGDLWGNE